jgi:hypothetical protein
MSERIFYTWADLARLPRDPTVFDGRSKTRPYVYVILAWRHDVFSLSATNALYAKFGISNDPHERLADMQTGCPLYLDLWGICLGGRDLEKKIHDHLANYRIGGEWFSIADPVVKVASNFPDDVPSLFAH